MDCAFFFLKHAEQRVIFIKKRKYKRKQQKMSPNGLKTRKRENGKRKAKPLSRKGCNGARMQWTALETVPAKLKVFAWWLTKNSIPTESVRHHRNMAQTNLCQICQAAEDTWRHALIYCTMASVCGHC